MRPLFFIVLTGFVFAKPVFAAGSIGMLDAGLKRAKCIGLFRAYRDSIVLTLPPAEGTIDSIPRSLARKPQNRILFGIEGEYAKGKPIVIDAAVAGAGDQGPQRLFVFYGGGPEDMSKEALSLKTERELAMLPESDRWLAAYLPSSTIREIGKNATQEIVTDVLPNYGTFERVLDELHLRVGHGSYQGMVSVPYETVEKFGAAEIGGLLYLSNELSFLSAVAEPREFHPALHPFNQPLKNDPGHSRASVLKRELDRYFASPAFESELEGKQMRNPKFTLGIAPRFDLSAKYAGARLFFEIRGCKENPDCVKAIANQIRNVFENETTGFSKFSALGSLLNTRGRNSEAWILSEFFDDAFEHDGSITFDLDRVFSIFREGGIPDAKGIDTNFLYPFKDWGSIASALGLNAADVERLAAAQNKYWDVLSGHAWRPDEDKTAPDVAMRVLGPALRDFARDSGLLAHFQSSWQSITGIPWNVRF